MSDIEIAVNKILERRPVYDEADAYYEGTKEEVFASRKMRQLLGHTGEDFRVNFAATVVDSVLNRLELAGVNTNTKIADDVLGGFFQHNDLMMESNEIHRRALVYGDAYAIVWPDEQGNMEVFYNSPKTTTIVYDDENPRRKRFAAKMWQLDTPSPDDNSVRYRLNLYYPDRIERYISKGKPTKRATDWLEYEEPTSNPFGQVPVFHFRTDRPYGKPEHRDAYGPQDAINKLVVTQMYTIDYQGAPQRYALASNMQSDEVTDFEEGDTDRENVDALRHGPGELWFLKGVTEVGQFSPADADAFIKPMREYVRAMASTTATPLHYFERGGTVPSGEALRVAEAPLLKKAHDRQLSFGATWRELFTFVLRAEGRSEDVQVKWHLVESLDSVGLWEVANKKRRAGMPLRQCLIELGYDTEVIEAILKMKQDDVEFMTTTPAVQDRVEANQNESEETE